MNPIYDGLSELRRDDVGSFLRVRRLFPPVQDLEWLSCLSGYKQIQQLPRMLHLVLKDCLCFFRMQKFTFSTQRASITHLVRRRRESGRVWGWLTWM